MSSENRSVPYGYCQCGCGEKTRLADRTSPLLDWVKGEPLKRIHGHQGRVPGALYVVDQESGCWVWQRGLNPDGYAMLNRRERRGAAHILFYEEHVGPVPDGLQLDHLCRNRACVNPDHLEAVTQAVNCQRGLNAKLTPSDVLAIRASPLSGLELSRRYRVSTTAISRVRLRKTWRNI